MTSEGQYAGAQPAEATSGGPTSDGFPPDNDGQRASGRASAPPPADGFPSSYGPPPQATPNGGSPFVVPAVPTFGQGPDGPRASGTSYGSARVPQPDAPRGPQPEAGQASQPAGPGALPQRGAASPYGSVAPADPGAYGPVPGSASPYGPPPGEPAGVSAPTGEQAQQPPSAWAPPPSIRPAGEADSPFVQRPGAPLPQRNAAQGNPVDDVQGFNGFAAGQPGREPAEPATGRPPGVSAFGDQRVRVPGATLTDLPDVPPPVRTGDTGSPARPAGGAADSGGFPLRGGGGGGSSFPIRRGDSGGFPRRTDRDDEAEAPAAAFPPPAPFQAPAQQQPPGDLPVRPQQAPFGAPAAGSAQVPGAAAPAGGFNAFGASADDNAPHPYGRSSAEPFAEPFGRLDAGAPAPAGPPADDERGGLPDPFGRAPGATAPQQPAYGSAKPPAPFGQAAANAPDQPFGTRPASPAYGSARPPAPFGGENEPRADAPAFGSARPAPPFGQESPAEPGHDLFGGEPPFPTDREPSGGFRAQRGDDGGFGNQQPGSDEGFGGRPPYVDREPTGDFRGRQPAVDREPSGEFGAQPFPPAREAAFGSARPVSPFGPGGEPAADGGEADDHALYRRPGQSGDGPSGYPRRVPGAALDALGSPAAESRNGAVPQPRDPSEHPPASTGPGATGSAAVGSARPVTASASVPTASRVAPVDEPEIPSPPSPQARVYGRPAPAEAGDEPGFPDQSAESDQPVAFPVDPSFPGRSDDDRPQGFGSPAYPSRPDDHSPAYPSRPDDHDGPADRAAPGVAPQSPARATARASASARVAPPGTSANAGSAAVPAAFGSAPTGAPGTDQESGGSPFGERPGNPPFGDRSGSDRPGGSPFGENPGAAPGSPFGGRPGDGQGSPFGGRPGDGQGSPFGGRPGDGQGSAFGGRPGDGPGGSPFGDRPGAPGASPFADLADRPGAPGPRPGEPYSELTTDIAGREREQPYVPAPALPPMPPGINGFGPHGQPSDGDPAHPAARATVTPPSPNDTTSWPTPEPDRFDQFKPEVAATPATPAAKPETPHVRLLPILLAVVIGAILLLGVVFGIVYLVAGGGDDTLAVKQGECVKPKGQAAVKAECSDTTAFQVVSIVADKGQCPDQKQPYVINPTGEGNQVLCLKPNS